ncbi:DUF488 domain-containing protein [Gilvimarinus polysaccharolyticus]|uniref:DUF488 domain-containing protein n=1 Tax=Gilvimarinus polysaccharolyticus TaxID=863921 RepID=UPI000673B4C8|nr:DUF488 family protein [Gilvimarinus polysaccharolyticus]
MKPVVAIKRLYDNASPQDGMRILVDRLWPRERKREDLNIDDWQQHAAPSNGLRQCWLRGELTPEAFSHAYRNELNNNPDNLTLLLRHARNGRLTLLSANRDPNQSPLPILRQYLLDTLAEEDRHCQSEPSSPICYGQAAKTKP